VRSLLETIHDLGLELQVIFNKGADMVLPGGTNKASGLKAALEDLSISLHSAVGVGDAENDHASSASANAPRQPTRAQIRGGRAAGRTLVLFPRAGEEAQAMTPPLGASGAAREVAEFLA
jgi:hypothetical protein